MQLLIRIFLFLMVSSLAACQLMPKGTQYIHAPELDFSSIQTNNFDLLVASNRVNQSNILNVYIEGDGTPWVNRYFIAKDPGPYGKLALDLMRQDTHAAFYLGRPCYYSWRLPPQKNCSPILWTDARYSQEVVDSMATALNQYLSKHSFQKINLIGHSGGGTLAYLIAQQVEAVTGVIIISGNLDTDAWTRHHHYTRLSRSVNPTTVNARKNLPVIYLTGEKDQVVPSDLNAVFLESIQARVIVRPEYDHVCCWRNEWQDLIHELVKSL